MKKTELKKRLQQMEVPTHLYNLDGTGRTDERVCLEFTDNAWYVYFEERGKRTTNKKFASEDEACQYIYEDLLQLLRYL